MAKDNNNFEFIALNTYELPVIQSNYKTHKWVKYGEDNLFPREMREYLSFSATHKGIIDLKKSLVAGNGFVDSDGQPVDLELNSKMSDFETLKRIANDYSIYNGFALQILWSNDGQTIAEIRHIDFSRIRAEWDDYDNPKGYYYCRDWEHYNLPRNRPKYIPIFDPEKVVKDGHIVQPKQIYYFYELTNDLPYYPLPTYSSIFKDIEFDYQYGLFKANSMKNGMFPSIHLEVQGEPDQEKKKAFAKKIKDTWQGSEKAGGVLITYGSEGDGSVRINQIQADAGADKFVAWKEDTIQNIVSGHGLTSPTLAGLSGNGNLSGNAMEMVTALEQFQNSYVDEKQDYIIEVFERLLPYKGYEGEIDIADKRPFTVVPDILWDLMTSEDIVRVANEKYGIELSDTNLPNDGMIQDVGEPSEDIGEVTEDIQKSAFNGAQVSSMVEVVAQVNQGILPRESAVEILKIAFQLTDEEAWKIVGQDGNL